MNRCPKGVDPMAEVINLRSVLVEDGAVPKKISDVLKSIDIRKNPWGMGKDLRVDWIEGLNVKNIVDTPDVEVLYFVCCTPAFDKRLQKIPRGISKVLQKAGIEFGILGVEEVCCGNEIKRLGDIWDFEALRDKNMENFTKYPIKQIIVSSPHCFNTFKNEYTELKAEVKHYTQVVDELISQKRLTFSKGFSKKVTYHDPCFLGKHNKVFEEPRRILQSIPELTFIEFDRSRDRSLCCEGGGGRMWIEAFEATERTATIRVKDALDMGVDVIATACPFCILTLEDAVKTLGLEDKLKVMDVIEIVGQAMD
jgi:Fe-S oxidoreductase